MGHRPGDRADRERQDEYALLGRLDHQLPGHEHHDGRGPGRVQRPEHQPGPDQGRDRADVRGLPAELPPAGPRHHARRRDARPGDGRHRHQGRPDRPPRLLDHPHQRRRQLHHPHGEHEHRALPDRRLAHPGRGPAPRPPAVQEVRPAPRAAGGRPARDGLPEERAQGPPAHEARRLRLLQQDRLQGPDGPVRGHEGRRRHPDHDPDPGPVPGDQAEGHREGHADPAAERPRQDQERRHLGRRGPARDGPGRMTGPGEKRRIPWLSRSSSC